MCDCQNQRLLTLTPCLRQIREFLSKANLQYAADGFFALGLESLDDLNRHPW